MTIKNIKIVSLKWKCVYLGQKTVHIYCFFLPKAIDSEDALDVIWWIPASVKHHDPVCSDQIDSQRPRTSGDQKQPSSETEETARVRTGNADNLNVTLNFLSIPYVFSVVKLLSPSLASTSTGVAVQTIIIFIFNPCFLSWQYRQTHSFS